jgi:predicted transcriptional regulator
MESINRIKNKTENFTIVSNEIFQRSDVSARAKGVYAYIMTLPDDWKIYKQEIFTHFSEGKNALDSAFKELEKLGYISKEKTKNEKGQFVGWDYTIYESATEDIETDRMESRVSDLPKSVNRQLQSTDSLQSTDKQSTNKQNIEQSFFDNGELNQIFLDFIADRKKRGKKMTDKAIELTVKKLKGFRSDSSRIKAITESIANGWIGIFEPAEDSPKKKYDRTANANFDGLKSGEVDF